MAPNPPKTLAAAVEPLEPAADVVQGAMKALPQGLRNVLDGVWFGNPLHPALTDVPIGAWAAGVLLGAAGADEAADAALARSAFSARFRRRSPASTTGAGCAARRSGSASSTRS